MSTTVYDVVGGEDFFVDLVNEFYDRVEADELLMKVYPADLAEPRRTTAAFLAQYWGGPPHYSHERGHPRLRMRHAPFVIRQAERDAWLGHMLGALRLTLEQWEASVEGERETVAEVGATLYSAMAQYFETGSTAMINS